MGIKSRRKGKAGERAAAVYLRSLGFSDARRTEQHCGNAGDSDAVCVADLPKCFIEVKYGYRMPNYHGSQKWADACEIAALQCPDGHAWCILFRPYASRTWYMSFVEDIGGVETIVTVTGDAQIRRCLIWLNVKAGGSST